MPLDVEFQKLIEDNFWDLVDGADDPVLDALERYRLRASPEEKAADLASLEAGCISDWDFIPCPGHIPGLKRPDMRYIVNTKPHDKHMITISKRVLIEAVAGAAVAMHPYNDPPALGRIIAHLSAELGKAGISEVPGQGALCGLLKDMLFSCPEFRQLNISKSRWDQGQRDIDQDGRFMSCSGDPRENDFVDIWALCQNAAAAYIALDDDGCFLCAHASEYGSMEPSAREECARCFRNPALRDERQWHPWALLPRNSEEYQALVRDGRITGMEL